MFFIMGVTQGSKEFDFTQNIVCPKCGRSGNYVVYMTYMVLTLFFIPCFKWKKQYFVRTTCCDTVYSLDPEVGKCIARGDAVTIQPQDLYEISAGYAGNPMGSWGNTSDGAANAWTNPGSAEDAVNPWTNTAEGVKVCPNCGYKAAPDFDYCPKCGTKL